MSYKSNSDAQQEAEAAKSLGVQHSIIKMLGQVLETWNAALLNNIWGSGDSIASS